MAKTKKPLARKKLSKPAAPPVARTARPGKGKATKSSAEVKRAKAQAKNAKLVKQVAAGARAKPSTPKRASAKRLRDIATDLQVGALKLTAAEMKKQDTAASKKTKKKGDNLKTTTSVAVAKETIKAGGGVAVDLRKEKRRAETGKPAITPKEATKIVDAAYRDAAPHGATRDQVKESLERAGLTPESLMTEGSKFVYKFAPVDGKEFIPSVQQIGLFDWVRLGTGNAFVEAVAGSGKTTSLLRAIQFMKGSVVCIAFGAKIAEEFKLKVDKMGLSDKVQVMTAHAAGNRALRSSQKYRHTVLCKNFEKSDAMLTALKPEGYQEFPPHLAKAVIKLVGLARQSGVMVTWDLHDTGQWEDLVDHYSVDDLIPEHLDPVAAMKEAIKYAIAGVQWSLDVADKMIEFHDMCWVPLVKGLVFPKFDWVLVDEAQDLSAMRRLIAAALMKKEARLVAVGDRHQAIFGFTGADDDSVDQIIEGFNCTKLPLTVTYRCTKAIAAEAQKIVPHIVARDDAPEGVPPINMGKAEFEEKVMMNLTPDDVVLCTINRPLVSLAFRLIRAGVACHVEGRSIGDGLISLAKKWKSAKTTEQLDGWLTKYLGSETDRLTAKKQDAKLEAVRDRVETLRIFMEGTELVSDVIVKIEGLFKDTNGDHKATVILSSIHKFKGREKPNVYILGKTAWLPPPWAKKPWEKRQGSNLEYVAQTRAMTKLVYLEKLDEDKH